MRAGDPTWDMLQERQHVYEEIPSDCCFFQLCESLFRTFDVGIVFGLDFQAVCDGDDARREDTCRRVRTRGMLPYCQLTIRYGGGIASVRPGAVEGDRESTGVVLVGDWVNVVG